jgi:hypothetical protein
VASLDKKQPFHENRWDCLVFPETAAMTLGPYATLDLTIVQAENLVLSSAGVATKLISRRHPFVKIFIDDEYIQETPKVPRAKNPVWDSQMSLGITIPTSMVRLQVFDNETAVDPVAQDALNYDFVTANRPVHMDSLGFVEFNISDVPLNEEIEGWMELRFAENLQGSSVDRYQEHCDKREDDVRSTQDVGKKPANETKKVMVKRSQGMTKRVTKTFINHDEGEEDSVQYNAGQIYVKLKFRRDPGTWLDSVFALALDAPVSVYTSFVQQEHLPELNVQELYDDTIDLIQVIWNDFLLYFVNWFLYILLWRSPLLSGTITVLCIMSAFDTDHRYITVHGLFAALLVMNKFDTLRSAMTIGGMNAELTEEGFKTVAAWRSSWQMEQFLMRILEARGYWPMNERRFHKFVAVGFRRNHDQGEPTFPSLESVVDVLLNMDYVERLFPDAQSFRKGVLVRVDGQRRGTVQKLTDNDCVSLNYDEPPSPRGDVIEPKRLVRRTIIPTVQNMFLNTDVKECVRSLSYSIDRSKWMLQPILDDVSDIFTWRKRNVTIPVFVYNFGRTVLAVLSKYSDSPTIGILVRIMRSLKWLALGLLALWTLLVIARPMAWIFAAGRVCGRLGKRQKAPAIWAFFRRGDEHAIKMDSDAECNAGLVKEGTAGSSPSSSRRGSRQQPKCCAVM